MYKYSKSLIILFIVFISSMYIDYVFSAEISFEWSPEGYDDCPGCTFDLWKNGNIISPDIPKTQTTISVPLIQEQGEDDYKLTAKNPQQRSAFSRVVRVGDDNFPVITKITQTK